jgi:endo-1,4-beta-xylanase
MKTAPCVDPFSLTNLGDDFVTEAFRIAQKAAPNTELYYNDYNIEQPKKRAGAYCDNKKNTGSRCSN